MRRHGLQTILLGDDESNLRTLVRTTLEGGDCRILEASSGTDALDLAVRERPDVVVLDVMMPGMTGLEVLRRLRGQPETADIPVVMLTQIVEGHGGRVGVRSRVGQGSTFWLWLPVPEQRRRSAASAAARRARRAREAPAGVAGDLARHAGRDGGSSVG